MSNTGRSLPCESDSSYDSDAPSPPPYQERPPPPYRASNDTLPRQDTYQPPTRDKNFHYPNPEAPSESTPLVSSSSFEDKAVRRGFVRKVFGLLTLQLLFTFSAVSVFTFSPVVKKAVQTNHWAYRGSFILFAVVVVTLILCDSLRRRHPWNLSGLVVVTLSGSYMVGTVASFHNTSTVVITMAVTLVISAAVIAFSAQTRYDFTFCYGFLLIVVVDFVMFGFLYTFCYSHITNAIHGCLGALLYALFLVVDCQLMMGRMSYRLDPEEYIYAALMIYLDIFLIFLYLLGKK
ncbi:protein lifeguard 1-like [Oryzias latipes]|uniref:protein lifeguard 1-like n=1 Tax=Oryzias latipes TaxID=8090 RepID=UPI0005CBCDAC|nr:protein lifeguard 1-like [Oryzias latipes]XP_023821141.1 protein lifeguard 1-like [Oryzias latipes]